MVVKMKICFSTLGCPEWTFKDIVASAKDLGFDGIEIRGIESNIYLPKAKEFSPEKIQSTKEYLNKTGIEISAIATGAVLYKDCFKEVYDYISLAAELGVKYLRILGDDNPQASVNANDEATIKALEKLLPEALDKNVVLCLETNGIYANSKRLAKVLEHFDGKVGALWDIHHPYRFFGETPEETYNNIKKYLKHVHIKDSVISDSVIIYKMLGEGDVPVFKVLDILSENNYSGYISLEWVKRWNKELEEPSIVFAHFINAIKQ